MKGQISGPFEISSAVNLRTAVGREPRRAHSAVVVPGEENPEIDAHLSLRFSNASIPFYTRINLNPAMISTTARSRRSVTLPNRRLPNSEPSRPPIPAAMTQ